MTEFVKRNDQAWSQRKDAVGVNASSMSTKVDDLFRDEDDYWRTNYTARPYIQGEPPYEEWQPAYRYGFQQRAERIDESWENVEDDLERSWDSFKASSKLTWKEAKEAVRDAWHHIESKLPGDADGDGR